MSEQEDPKKELAKRKRIATDIASQIHDIVEDRLWTDYMDLSRLSQEAIQAVQSYHDLRKSLEGQG